MSSGFAWEPFEGIFTHPLIRPDQGFYGGDGVACFDRYMVRAKWEPDNG